MTTLTRRGLLAASAALACAAALPFRALAGTSPDFVLRAATRVLDVGGRAATILGLQEEAGQSGLVLNPSQRFRLELANDLGEATIVHWPARFHPTGRTGCPTALCPTGRWTARTY